MAKLFDDVSRILGSPLPRRHAVRLLVGGLAGSYMARWPGKAMAATIAGNAGGPGGGITEDSILSATAPFTSPDPGFCVAPGGTFCRAGTNRNFCCASGFTCCYPNKYRALCCRNADSGDAGETCCEPIGAPKQKRCCDLNDNCCCIQNGTRRCKPKAGAAVTSVLPGQIGIRIYDPGEDGLSRIRVLQTENARVDIPDFAKGVREVQIQAIKLDLDKPARLLVEAAGDCGPHGECPSGSELLIGELQVVEDGVSVSQTFTGVSRRQSFLQVQNGSPGVARVQVMVNGVKAWTLRVGENEVRGIDVASAMLSEKNTVVLLASGDVGAAALAMLTLVPRGADGPNPAAELPHVEWTPAAAAQAHAVSRWGM